MLHVIIFMAGLVSGLTSFGFALVLVPLLTFYVPAKNAVSISLLLSNIPRIILIIETWKWMKIRQLTPLLAAGVVGTLIGSYFFYITSNTILKFSIGSITILAAILLLLGYKKPLQNEHRGYIPVGLLSGFLQGSMGMGGPPVVIFQSNQNAQKHIFRANNTLLFTILSIVAVCVQIIGGFVTKNILFTGLKLTPALIAGTMCGSLLSHKISESLFQKITLLLIVLTGIAVIIPLIF